MSFEVRSWGALKDIAERHRGIMDRLRDDPQYGPKDYPVKLHIRYVVSDEDRDLIDVDKTKLINAMGLSDILSKEDLAIIHEDDALIETVDEIYDNYLKQYDCAQKNIGIIGKHLEVGSGRIEEFEEAVLIDCYKQKVIDGRICNVALRLLAKPVDSNLPPGIKSSRDANGSMRYIVEDLPDATTEEIYYKLANYHKTMMAVVKDF